jgi:hypothetical protein
MVHFFKVSEEYEKGRISSMTSPILAQDSPYGRLYRHPKTSSSDLVSIERSLAEGLLMPSVTNIIGSLDKPFLTTWYAKLAAESAVETVHKYPGLIESKPDNATKHFKEAALRKLDAAGILGDAVHNAVESFASGKPGEYPDYIAGYIDSYHKFIEKWHPDFLHLEVTCFGTVEDSSAGSLKYAGTADFVAKVNGLTVIGDWKSGRSVHTDAGLQISALANATEMVTSDGNIIEMPKVEAGMVVHLTSKGFFVYQTQPFGIAWDTFGTLRKAWDFHVANLATRNPLLMSRPVKDPEAFTLENAMNSASLASGILISKRTIIND